MNQTYQASTNLWNTALNGITSTVKSTKTKTKKVLNFKNIEFINAISLVEDEYWRDRLTNAALGRFPTGFKYMNGILRHIKKKTMIVLPKNNDLLLAEVFIKFLRDNGNFYSPAEMQRSKEYEHTQIQDIQNLEQDDWKNASKTKYKKLYYIREYIDKRYSHLEKRIRDELFTIINNFFELGVLTSKDILYHNDEIDTIYGICANENGIIFKKNFNIPNIKITYKCEEKPKIYCHREHWRKYNENFFKFVSSRESNDQEDER